MFSTLTWKDFTLFITVVLLVYYCAVLHMYYRWEIAEIIRGGIPLNRIRQIISAFQTYSKAPQNIDSSGPTNLPAVVDIDNSFIPRSLNSSEDFNQLLEEIKEGILKAGEEKMVKQELLWLVRSLFQRYHHLKTTDNIIAVNDYVIQLADNHCNISLCDDEISPMWK